MEQKNTNSSDLDLSSFHSTSYLDHIKHVFTESVEFYARKTLPDYFCKCITTRVEQLCDINHIAFDVVAKMAAVKTHEITVEGVESEERLPSDLYWVPSRPVDHLIEFLRAYLPSRIGEWLWLRFAQEDTIPVERSTHKTITQYITKHYHLIPEHLADSRAGVIRFIDGWQGDHYSGTPKEWGDLVELRDYILSGTDKWVCQDTGELLSQLSQIQYLAAMTKRKSEDDRL